MKLLVFGSQHMSWILMNIFCLLNDECVGFHGNFSSMGSRFGEEPVGGQSDAMNRFPNVHVHAARVVDSQPVFGRCR